MKWYENYNKFFEIFNNSGIAVDETAFYFKTDINEKEHYIGFISKQDKPYWAGYCDITNGCAFKTAEELFNAKIYDGKSIKERWNQIVIIQISGIPVEDWDIVCLRERIE
ncbi:MAG TPA: hypothetical protein DD413_05685 [Ruminococcus sp.]|nr:hypothetical protein [Ruminococcus sp.]